MNRPIMSGRIVECTVRMLFWGSFLFAAYLILQRVFGHSPTFEQTMLSLIGAMIFLQFNVMYRSGRIIEKVEQGGKEELFSRGALKVLHAGNIDIRERLSKIEGMIAYAVKESLTSGEPPISQRKLFKPSFIYLKNIKKGRW